MTRKTKRDWYSASVHILDEIGSKGLTIDLLTKKLGVTKGSFYHHFKNYQDFKTSFLRYFEEEGTLNIITETEEADSPQTKLQKLMEIILGEKVRLPANVEPAVRAWALQDEEVKALLTRIDQQRIAYVQALCTAITGNAEQSLLMAQMMYAILVGSEQMMPSIAQTRLRVLFDEFLRLYGLGEEVK